jgi:hypothetical protein
MVDANNVNYIMGLGTSGGSDTTYNSCGIANGHAYSLQAPFEMTDASGTVHKVLLIRNPWGTSGYSGTWNKDDSNWTDALVA